MICTPDRHPHGQRAEWVSLAEGCNLHYALYEIGPWQGSQQVVWEKKFLLPGVNIAWPGRGTTLVSFEQQSGSVDLAPSWLAWLGP